MQQPAGATSEDELWPQTYLCCVRDKSELVISELKNHSFDFKRGTPHKNNQKYGGLGKTLHSNCFTEGKNIRKGTKTI